jgi:integrase
MIESDFIERYLIWRREHPIRAPRDAGERSSVSTVDRHRSTLPTMFEHAKDMRQAVATNPAARAVVFKKEREGKQKARKMGAKSTKNLGRMITATEHRLRLDKCGKDHLLHRYVLLGGDCGPRPDSETMTLRWDDIGFDRRCLEIVYDPDGEQGSAKTGPRSVPMTRNVFNALLAQQARARAAGPPWVFAHTKSRLAERAS